MTSAESWVLVSLDEKMAKRHGMPARVPVPKDKFEELGDAGLTHQFVQAWIKAFLGQATSGFRTQHPADAKSFDAYLAKMSLWKQAEAAFERRDFAGAEQPLLLITNIDRDDFAARHSLAVSYAASGKVKDAIRQFEEALPVWQGVADFHLAYANALLLGVQKEQAIEQFVLALEAQPDSNPALEGLAKLGVLIKIYEDPLDAKSLIFVRADSLLEYLQGEWDKAELSVDQYLRIAGYHEEERRFEIMLAAAERALKAGANPFAGLAKTRALRKLGRLEEARGAAREVLERDPSSASAHVELAEIAHAEHDAVTTATELDSALELEPGHLTALSLKFLPHDESDLDGLARSLPELERFAASHAGVSGVQRIVARAKKRVGAEALSFEAFAKAVELAPEDEDVRAEYWSELAQAARFDDVLRDAERLGNMGQRDWKLRWSEAEALIGAGKRMEARAAYAAINADQSLHVTLRARAKRAVQALGE